MLQMRYPQKSHDLVMRNRVSFALSDLAISGLLDRPKRGLYLPTSRGQELIRNTNKKKVTKRKIDRSKKIKI
ncbi:hypothetical protein [Limosilactobacillus agrestis]